MKREYYEIGRPLIEKAGMAHKVDFREGPALPILDQLVSEVIPSSNPSSCLTMFSINTLLMIWMHLRHVICIPTAGEKQREL